MPIPIPPRQPLTPRTLKSLYDFVTLVEKEVWNGMRAFYKVRVELLKDGVTVIKVLRMLPDFSAVWESYQDAVIKIAYHRPFKLKVVVFPILFVGLCFNLLIYYAIYLYVPGLISGFFSYGWYLSSLVSQWVLERSSVLTHSPVAEATTATTATTETTETPAIPASTPVIEVNSPWWREILPFVGMTRVILAYICSKLNRVSILRKFR